MVEKTSSAGQLYKILNKAFNLKSKNISILHIWAEELKVEVITYQNVSDKLAELFELFSDARKDILQLDQDYRDIGIEAISHIQSIILKHGLNTYWNLLVKEIDQASLKNLKLCDGLLIAQGICQKSLSKDKSIELLGQVENLIQEFYQSEFPNSLKSDLIRELIKIKTALMTFDITGESHLQKICNEVQGSIIDKAVRQPELFKECKQVVQKVVSIVVTIGGLISTCDLLIKYQPILTENIMRVTDNILESPDNEQLRFKAASEPQEMNAEVEDNYNHQCLPYQKEEE